MERDWADQIVCHDASCSGGQSGFFGFCFEELALIHCISKENFGITFKGFSCVYSVKKYV